MAHFVDGQKFAHNLSSECIASTTRRKREFISFGVWIAPDQVRHWTLVRDFPESIDDFYLVDAMYAWAQSSVYTKNLVVDDHTEGKKVEHVGEIVPDVGVAVLAIALGIETVRLGDAPRFMVAPDEMDALRISKLKADKKRDSFDRKETAINIVALNMVRLGVLAKHLNGQCRGLPRKR